MAKINQKWYEATLKSIGMYKGMNGWLETVIPYEELEKPTQTEKEDISPAAFIRNPAYQSNFSPETADAVNMSERVHEKSTMRLVPSGDTDGVAGWDDLYWSKQVSFYTRDIPAGKGVTQQGNNFWPAIQNSYFVNESRMYYKGYLANVLGFYTAYYQHWQGGMTRFANNSGNNYVFPLRLSERDTDYRYLKSYFSQNTGGRYAGWGNNKKLVKTLNWKMSKKGAIYPARPTGVNVVGIDLPGYEKYGDVTAWPQMMWGRLPMESPPMVYAQTMSRMPDEVPTIITPIDEPAPEGNIQVAVDLSQFDNKYVIRANTMSGLDPLDFRLDELIKILGRNYSIKSYINAAKMISHSGHIYPFLKGSAKPQFEEAVLSWLNTYCPPMGGTSGMFWDSEKLQLFDNFAVCIQKLIPGYDDMLKQGWDNKLLNIMGVGDVAHTAGFYDEEQDYVPQYVNINMPSVLEEAIQQMESSENPDYLNGAVQVINTITAPDGSALDNGNVIFALLNVVLCTNPEILHSDYSANESQGTIGHIVYTFLRDTLNFRLDGNMPRAYGKCMIGDTLVMNTPAGNLMEGSLNDLKKIREECSLQNYPEITEVEIRDGDNQMTLTSQNKFIKSYWDVELNPLTTNLYETDNIPNPVICNLIILDAPMPVVDSRVQKTNPEYYANFGYVANQALTVGAKSLMTPFSQYDDQWWNSFLSKEDGFLRYFETCDWVEPFQLKKCWDTMELWESLATHETSPEPFVRPFWATIGYQEAFLKIYQGQEILLSVNDEMDQGGYQQHWITTSIVRHLPSMIIEEYNLENYRCFTKAKSLTQSSRDGDIQQLIKNQLSDDPSEYVKFTPGFWEENEYDQIIDGDTNTMMVSINSWLSERDRYNQGIQISTEDGSMSASLSEPNSGWEGLIANFDNISNYVLMNPRVGNRYMRQAMPNLWLSILNFGWSAGRDNPAAVSSARDAWAAAFTDSSDSQLVSQYSGPLKPYEIDVFSPQGWDFSVNRVFAGAKSGYRFIINWTRILSYRMTNLLSN